MYNPFLSPNARKFLKRCIDKNRIIKKIKDLSSSPFPSDVKRVAGRSEKVFRAKVEPYRILYVVFEDKKEILVSDIDKRSRVYD